MKMTFYEWVNKILPLMINRTIDKAEADVQEGTAKAYFYGWELRFELTPNRALGDKIINRGGNQDLRLKGERGKA